MLVDYDGYYDITTNDVDEITYANVLLTEGTIFVVDVDGVEYDYTVAEGDGWEEVLSALADDIEAGAPGTTIYDADDRTLTYTPDATEGIDGAAVLATDDDLLLDIDTDPAVSPEDAEPVIGDQSHPFFEGSLQVTFKGVESEWVDIDYTNYTTSSRQINQAIIDAIGGDNELQKLIAAQEGPADSLLFESLIDGLMDAGDLDVDIRGPVFRAADVQNGDGDISLGGTVWKDYLNTVTKSQLDSAWEAYYPGSDGVGEGSGTAGSYAAFLAEMQDAAFALTDVNGAYDVDVEAFGSDSTDLTSNVINAGRGDDVIVLSSNNVGEPNQDLSDTVVFTGTFGTTTILHFAVPAGGDPEEGAAYDQLDFTSYLDMIAATRPASAEGDDYRYEETVPVTFENEYMGGTFNGDHNQIGLLRFSDLWTELDDDADATAPDSFADFGAGDLETALNLGWNVADNVGNSWEGNQFLVLVGKDGEIRMDEGSVENDEWIFDGDYATNEFKVFTGEVVEDDGDLEFSILGMMGTVDLADTDLAWLTADNFTAAA